MTVDALPLQERDLIDDDAACAWPASCWIDGVGVEVHHGAAHWCLEVTSCGDGETTVDCGDHGQCQKRARLDAVT